MGGPGADHTEIYRFLEQREHANRIYRPESLYKGPQERPFVPVEKRG